MRRSTHLLSAAAVVVLFLPIRASTQIKLPGVPIPNRDTIQQKLLERALRGVLDNELPVKLDAKSVYRTTTKLPGGPFAPKPLQLTADNLTAPLPPGDYAINVLAFCTEYSVHRPGQGVAYELAPLQGKAAGAVANVLWRGTFQGMTPQHLVAVSWAIQSGLTYARLPKSFQDTIDKLIPDYKYELQGDFFQNVEDTYQRYAQGFQLTPLDSLLQEKMGKAGQLLLSAKRFREILLQQNTSDELKEQTLFAGQESGVYTPVRAEEGPWTVRIPDVAYIRYKIVGGHVASNNVIEIRILPHSAKAAFISPSPRLINSRYAGITAASPPDEQTSPLGIMGVTGSAQTALNASGMIGYSQGQEAQALIPVIPMPTSPQPQPKILFSGRDVTNGTQKVVVGQQIALTVDPNGLSIQSQSWTVPETKIKNYMASNTRGQIEQLTDLSTSEVSFYWVDAGASKDVTYTYMLAGGKTGSVHTTFQVVGPTASFVKTETGSVAVVCITTIQLWNTPVTLAPPCFSDVLHRYDIWLYFGGTQNNIGITFTPSVDPPTGYVGNITLVQIVESTSAVVHLNDGSAQTCEGLELLDANYPYLKRQDNPGILLGNGGISNTYIVEARIAQTFRTFLLWEPRLPGFGSIPVPLGSVAWRWYGQATHAQRNQKWELSDTSSGSADAFQLSNIYPAWQYYLSPKGLKFSIGLTCR